ncbi:SRPBCC family protein [Primorskyibacter sedentarius]|uniref:SRPBCC family protein n=1 Tax=Primorskyibacter sedentarius TaxID=745311 RepID=UPI003EC067BE
MTEPVVIERVFDAPREMVFTFITTRALATQWWGHDGMSLPEENLDFSRPGPWFAQLVGAEGGRYKMSGQVTKVVPPSLVAFTWGWHDENDARGAESHVMITLDALDGDRTRLVLRHEDLQPGPQRDNHSKGWAATLARLEKALAASLSN